MTGANSRYGLERQGMRHLGAVHWNQLMPVLYEHAVRRGEGEVAAGGSFSACTGAFTGRTPRDKYIVEEPGTKDTVWWGKINQPIAARALRQPAPAHARLFSGPRAVRPGSLCRGRPAYRLPVRVVTDSAWHSLFARNMFIRPPTDELAAFEPAFTILHAPNFLAIPETRPDQLRDLHLRQFRRAAGADRRHRLCRRDQEIGLRLSELRAAGARRAADARLGQCRAEGRLRDLLRAFRHRQDDAVRRRLAHPDRRRRARLEPEGRLQFRGRLLRQGDQSVAGSRAGDLRDARAASARCWRMSCSIPGRASPTSTIRA